MTSSLDQRFAALQARLSAANPVGMAEINAATDFAIDANAARRADLSVALLDPLSRRAPENAKIWQMLGLAWRDEQEMAKAGAAFERAHRLAPHDLRIAMGKAQLAFESGRPAAEKFQRVRAAAPLDGELALSTAAALVHEGKAAEGEALITDLLAREPAWLRGLDALTTMRWMMGDTKAFDRAFAQSTGARPHELGLYIAWYRATSQVGQWDKAAAVISECRRIFGSRPEIDALDANRATETGDDEAAEILFARCARLDDSGTKISHIRHCLRTGRYDQAEQIGLSLAKGNAASSVWPYLSTIWRLKGDSRADWLDVGPSAIGQFDLPVSPTELEALAARLRALHIATHHPPEQSLRGGTQTQGHLFLRLEPEILAIRAQIIEAVRAYVAALPAAVEGHPLLGTPRNALLFEGAWSVRLTAAGYHVVHTHPLGWISSAFYVALPETMGDRQAGWLQLGEPPADLRLNLPPYAVIQPKLGRLVLFPSTMWHGTIPFDDGERLTIAFDIRRPVR